MSNTPKTNPEATECIIEATYIINNINEETIILGQDFKSFNTNNCDIYIDNELIPFSNKHIFQKQGEIQIKYKLKGNINTEINNMRNMYYNCTNLTKIKFPSAFHTNNVTDMMRMFNQCTNLTSISFSSSFDTINVTNMSYMFQSCINLTSISFPSCFHTNNVTDMSYMFDECSQLVQISFPVCFNTRKVADMSNMFKSCNSLQKINFSQNFFTENVTDMSNMFNDCTNIKSITFPECFDTEKVTLMAQMFYKCSNLTSITFSDLFDTQNVKDANNMFSFCSKLVDIKFPECFCVQAAEDMSDMFYDCHNLSQNIMDQIQSKYEYTKAEIEQKEEDNTIKEYNDTVDKLSASLTKDKISINLKEVAEYGKLSSETIKIQMKKKNNKLLMPDQAINNQSEEIHALGKFGKSLENSGMLIVIDSDTYTSKTSSINNKIITSGLLNQYKFEMHIDFNDSKAKKKIFGNKKKKRKFLKEWKTKIAQETGISEDQFELTNLRKGSVKFDVIFKVASYITKTEGTEVKVECNERLKTFALQSPEVIDINKKNIIEGCKLTCDMLDSRGNQYPGRWASKGEKRGGFDYFPPDDTWIGYGLKVKGLFENDNWIASNGNANEWAIAYHGTSKTAVNPIYLGKFFSSKEEGAHCQKCANRRNINPLSNKEYPICGEGAYCSPHLEYASKYYEGIILMCRVNPTKIRIPEGEYKEDEWIVDGTKDSIRPYRILIKKDPNKKYPLPQSTDKVETVCSRICKIY